MTDRETHLLIVEDEAPLRQATAERLAEHGYRVVEAESGEAAIEQLAKFAFDVVLTDLRLPGIDGTAVLEAASRVPAGERPLARVKVLGIPDRFIEHKTTREEQLAEAGLDPDGVERVLQALLVGSPVG